MLARCLFRLVPLEGTRDYGTNARSKREARFGASVGRSWTAQEAAAAIRAPMSETRPAHIVQLILSNVRSIPIAIPSAEHIATHAIVQAPCKVMAFIAVENAKT